MSLTQDVDIEAGGASDAAVGLAFFAATLMILGGVFQSIQGLVALLNDRFYRVADEWAFQFDLMAWGWIHLTLGAVLIVTGLFLFRGATWARWTAVLLTGLSAVANFMWLPYYPMWSIVLIGVDVAVIWALTTHGRAIDAALR